MAAEEQEIDWIYFELNDRKYRIDREDSNNLQHWKDIWRGQAMKKPYWWSIKLTKTRAGYLHFKVYGDRHYFLNRVVYYAHNQDWNLYDCSTNNFIDHIDQNPLNNHISNLRVATTSENQQNQNVKGYSYHKGMKKWQPQLRLNGKNIYLGYYDTEEEAREGYLKAKREHHPFFHES